MLFGSVLFSSYDLALYINSYSNIIWVQGWWKIPLVYQYMDYTGNHIIPHFLLPGPTTGVSFQCLLVPFKHISLYLKHTHIHGVSLVAQMVKNLPAMWETWVWSQGWEDPLEEGMATHSSVLSWGISMDRGAWRVTVHGVTKSQIQLSD